jgi:uncharacterized membrane protein YqjE
VPEPAPERPVAGLAAALSGIAATVVALLRTHLELATVEFEEVRARVGAMLALIVVATVFACCTFIALSVLVVVWLWDRNPLAVIAGVAVVYALIAACAALALKHQIHAQGRPFAATLSELERDAGALRRKT